MEPDVIVFLSKALNIPMPVFKSSDTIPETDIVFKPLSNTILILR